MFDTGYGCLKTVRNLGSIKSWSQLDVWLLVWTNCLHWIKLPIKSFQNKILKNRSESNYLIFKAVFKLATLDQNILGICLWLGWGPEPYLLLTVQSCPCLRNFFNPTYSWRTATFVPHKANLLVMTDYPRMETWQRVELTHSMPWSLQIIFLEKLNWIYSLACNIIWK